VSRSLFFSVVAFMHVLMSAINPNGCARGDRCLTMTPDAISALCFGDGTLSKWFGFLGLGVQCTRNEKIWSDGTCCLKSVAFVQVVPGGH
jgi:hypothetical protein